MLDLSYVGKWIHVQSYKHDGTLHRTWDSAMIVDVNEDYIVIASTCNKVIEADGRRWFTREPAVSVFFFKEWFNFIAMFKEEAIMYYCNIASPSLIDRDCIKYIDYDLDLKLMPDKSNSSSCHPFDSKPLQSNIYFVSLFASESLILI